MFGFELDVRKAEQTINKLIEMAKEYNGAVYLVDKENPDFCTKLDRPVGLTYWFPMTRKAD